MYCLSSDGPFNIIFLEKKICSKTYMWDWIKRANIENQNKTKNFRLGPFRYQKLVSIIGINKNVNSYIVLLQEKTSNAAQVSDILHWIYIDQVKMKMFMLGWLLTVLLEFRNCSREYTGIVWTLQVLCPTRCLLPLAIIKLAAKTSENFGVQT